MIADNWSNPPLQMVLNEYDEVLMGKRKSYSAFFMSRHHGDKVIKIALKYCFETYLQWTPEQVRECLTPELVKRMHIEGLINRIPCPPELNAKTELYYVAWWLYPETQNVSTPELMIKVYDDLLSEKITKFPKGYFDGILGLIHAKAIFLTMVKRYLSFDGPESMYAFFADTKQSKPIMKKYRLSVPLRELFDSPLDYLHEALPESQKREDLYQQYKEEQR